MTGQVFHALPLRYARQSLQPMAAHAYLQMLGRRLVQNTAISNSMYSHLEKMTRFSCQMIVLGVVDIRSKGTSLYLESKKAAQDPECM